MRLLISLFLGSLIYFNSALAQTMTWSEITDEFSLPDGIEVYAGVRSEPTVVKAWFAKVKFNSSDYVIKPVVTDQGVEEARNFAAREGSLVAINAGYFSGASSLSTIITEGIVYAKNLTAVTRNNQSHPVIRPALSWTSDSVVSVDWIYHFGSSFSDVYRFDAPMEYEEGYSAPLPAPLQADGTQFNNLFMSVGGGPMMIKDSVVNVTWIEELFDGASGVDPLNPQPRTAIGFTRDEIILMVVDGRDASNSKGLSIPDLAVEMLALGCVGAINLDGGGSSQIVVENRQLNKIFQGSPLPTRDVSSFVVVMPVSTGGGGGEDDEIILDTESDSVEIRGNWIETANSGFYGTSPSLVILAGEGGATVTYKPKLFEADYTVSSWWVAANNRSVKTPFIISHKEGIDTVYKNQSINGSKWNTLGTWSFTGTSSDSIMITNEIEGNTTYAVADGMLFEKIIDTTIENVIAERPTKAELLGNYPNPFNLSTVISFQLPVQAQVQIEIFNVLGQRLVSFSAKNFEAGTHSITWNASTLSSGVYLYKITASYQGIIQSNTRMMTLIK